MSKKIEIKNFYVSQLSDELWISGTSLESVEKHLSNLKGFSVQHQKGFLPKNVKDKIKKDTLLSRRFKIRDPIKDRRKILAFCEYLMSRKIVKAKLEDLIAFFSGETIEASTKFDWIRKEYHFVYLLNNLVDGDYAIVLPINKHGRYKPWKLIRNHFSCFGKPLSKHLHHETGTNLPDDLQFALELLK